VTYTTTQSGGSVEVYAAQPTSASGSNLDATVEPDEPGGASPWEVTSASSWTRSIWYRWTPATSGIVTFETSATSGTQYLGVYAGHALRDLVGVASDSYLV
jgi:hypothetical protein